jgi:uncharacterized membrane protein HdeD (DUF308 family)
MGGPIPPTEHHTRNERGARCHCLPERELLLACGKPLTQPLPSGQQRDAMAQESIDTTHRLHWGELKDAGDWTLLLGIALVALGAVAIGMAGFSTFISVMLIGALLLAGGVVMTMQAYRAKEWGGVVLSLLGGILYIVVGLLIITRPGIGAASLTLLLAAFFFVGGLFRALTAALERFPRWGWALLSGIVNVMLGVWMWARWPVTSLFMIGIFVGVELVFHGIAWLTLSSRMRNLTTRARTT